MKRLPDSIHSIVVRCPNWVGDIVMAIPVLDCLRARFPEAEIIGLLKKNAQGIVRDGPWFNGFIDCEDKSWSGFRRMVGQIRALQPDLALVLPNSLRSVLSLWAGRAQQIVGYRANGRSLLLTGGPSIPRVDGHKKAIPMVEYYWEIGRWLGIATDQPGVPHLHVGPDLRRRAAQVFEAKGIRTQGRVVGFNPGASFGPSKCWPPAHFARLAEICEQTLNAQVMLLSGPGEETIVQSILDQTKADIVSVGPEIADLEMLKPLVQRCDLFITNDTGPRHYAVAFGIPTVVIMGPTDPGYTNMNLDKSIVIRKELDCSPCHKKICPTDHRCMNTISPAEVLTAGKKLLET